MRIVWYIQEHTCSHELTDYVVIREGSDKSSIFLGKKYRCKSKAKVDTVLLSSNQVTPG